MISLKIAICCRRSSSDSSGLFLFLFSIFPFSISVCMQQKKRWNYKIYWNIRQFVQKQNLSFRLAWWIQWWPNFDMQFFRSTWINFSLCCVSWWLTTKKKPKTNKQTDNLKRITDFYTWNYYFFSETNPFSYFIHCVLFHKRPNKKCDWNEQVSKEKLPIGWSEWIIKWNKKKWIESNSWLAKTFEGKKISLSQELQVCLLRQSK